MGAGIGRMVHGRAIPGFGLPPSGFRLRDWPLASLSIRRRAPTLGRGSGVLEGATVFYNKDLLAGAGRADHLASDGRGQ
jgi:hypothetical protein